MHRQIVGLLFALATVCCSGSTEPQCTPESTTFWDNQASVNQHLNAGWDCSVIDQRQFTFCAAGICLTNVNREWHCTRCR
jgi:hypothetical protein